MGRAATWGAPFSCQLKNPSYPVTLSTSRPASRRHGRACVSATLPHSSRPHAVHLHTQLPRAPHPALPASPTQTPTSVTVAGFSAVQFFAICASFQSNFNDLLELATPSFPALARIITSIWLERERKLLCSAVRTRNEPNLVPSRSVPPHTVLQGCRGRSLLERFLKTPAATLHEGSTLHASTSTPQSPHR